MKDLRTKIGEGGRLIIPARFREHLHLDIGDEVILHIKGDELCITTAQQSLAKLQARVKEYMDKTDTPFSLVDTLINARRAEAQVDHE